jgi:hypothetical protein
MIMMHFQKGQNEAKIKKYIRLVEELILLQTLGEIAILLDTFLKALTGNLSDYGILFLYLTFLKLKWEYYWSFRLSVA